MVNNKKRLTELFLELVAIDGKSLDERRVADYIKSFFARLDLTILEDSTYKMFGGNCGNLFARINCDGREQETPILLMAHMDTVQSTADLQIVFDNEIIRSDGRTILGADDRAGVAIILYVMEFIIQNRLSHQNLEIVFTVGEELGMYGANHFDFKQAKSKEAYILDCSKKPGAYVSETPTATDFEIEVLGRAAHSAVNPDAGVNAIKMAIDLLETFPVGRINENTVANVGTISGGEAVNVVPDKVTMTGEIRSFDMCEIDRLKQGLLDESKKIAKSYGGEILTNFISGFEGFKLDDTFSGILKLKTAMRKLGMEPRALVYPGGSDANVVNQNGISGVNIGIGANNPHSNNENISTNDMSLIADLLLELIVIKN